MLSDGYAQWYADRLWKMIPPVYQSLDTVPAPGSPGPLQELVNRIGAQAAVVRRSIDRMGENQSIETCDDWAVPYIGDLVATRLVAGLDAAAKRVDVAKTIYYRRRAGTLGVLEELVADIASRDARVVEYFRRLGRTRHQFDPPLSYQIEDPINGPVGFTDSSLQVAGGLIGAYSGTPAGGFADLRNTYAASNTGSAFDEYSYTADLRNGGETLGHFAIRHLGVYVWWLQTFAIAAATPVHDSATPVNFTFDPTGRDIPLFAPSQRVLEAMTWGEHWVSPDEWELPVAVRQTLWRTLPDKLYPNAFSVGLMAVTSAPIPMDQLCIDPSTGRFCFRGDLPDLDNLTSSYSFGLMSKVGAGGYGTAILLNLPKPNTIAKLSGGSSADINPILASVSADIVLQIGDSLTYTGPSQALSVPDGATVVLAAAGGQRPVLRWNDTGPSSWIIAGPAVESGSTGTETILILEGLLLQGADIVLQGNFDSVYLRSITLDPGTIGTGGEFFGSAIDGLSLAPATLYIEGAVSNLILERSITGPIRTRNGGAVQQVTASDSIIQSLPTHAVAATGALTTPVIFDPVSLAASLKYGSNPLAQIAVASDPAHASDLAAYEVGTVPSAALLAEITTAIAQFTPAAAEAAWPLALADLALGFSEGTVSLTRVTVLGPTYTHRLQASESILDSIATVEDQQHGCMRFSTYTADSAGAIGTQPPPPYRCVQIPPQASIFVSRNFGEPEYAQLRSDADAWILSSASGTGASTILSGAQNGSEMGVYCLEAIPLKRIGLALKFEEYSPIGQLPVWVDVTRTS